MLEYRYRDPRQADTRSGVEDHRLVGCDVPRLVLVVWDAQAAVVLMKPVVLIVTVWCLVVVAVIGTVLGLILGGR